MFKIALISLALTFGSGAQATDEKPQDSYLLLVKYDHKKGPRGTFVRVLATPDKSECKRLGKKIISSKGSSWTSQYYCQKGEWKIGKRPDAERFADQIN